jgi:hypothetical protein
MGTSGGKLNVGADFIWFYFIRCNGIVTQCNSPPPREAV